MKKNVFLFLIFTAYLTSLILPLSAQGPAWPDYRLRGMNIVTRITQEDINHFVNDWGGNSVRILTNNLVPPPPAKPDPDRVAAVYRTLDMCLDAGLYTVLSFSPSFDDNDAFFSNDTYMQAYIDFWCDLVKRYADDTRGVAWDLMNEPHGSLAKSAWWPYANKLAAEIRKTDSIHTIVVEPPGWGWPYGFEDMKPIDDDNVIYSFHFYGPMDFTHQRNNGMLGATEEQWKSRKYPGTIQGEYWNRATMERKIRTALEWAEKYNIKLWCGEFGCSRWAVGAEQWIKDIISILEEEQIGWSWYAYREWYPMDIEMDPDARLEKTDRTETELVKYFKELFSIQSSSGFLTIPKTDVNIYPNPANDYINIVLSNQQKANATLFSSNGEAILNFGFNGKHHLTTSDKRPGLYLLYLTRNNSINTSKIIITR